MGTVGSPEAVSDGIGALKSVMRLSVRKVEYIRTHYRRFGDASLAKALGVDKAAVRKAREQRRLERTREEEQRIRNAADRTPPPYTGQLTLPEHVVTLDGRDYLLAAAAGVVALIVYLLTLAPTVTGEDSGELIAAAYTLGVPHPPGYPLWTVLGKLFTFIPYGTVAWRVNFMSAFWGAGTVFLAVLLGIKLFGARWAAAAAGLAFAFSFEFWEQAVIAEVYTLSTLLVAGGLLALLVWYDTRRAAPLYALAVAYGLGLANHNTMVLMSPLFVGFVLWVDREPWRRWRVYAACTGLALLAAALLYLYLPWASRRNPPVDWGNPETWDAFWDHVRREQYRFGFTANPRTLGGFVGQVGAFLAMYGRQFTPVLALVPVLGAYFVWQRDRRRFGLVAGLFGLTVVGFLLITNFRLDKESLWVNGVFFLPAYLAAALLLGAALAGLGSLRVRGRRLWVPAAVLALAAVAAPLGANWRAADKSRYWFAHDYGRNVLQTMEPDAVYIPTADHATFPALYLQAVEGLRPDIFIANKYGYPEPELRAALPGDVRARLRTIPTESEEQIIEDAFIASTDRPVYFTKKRALPGVRGARMAEAGLLYRVVKDGEAWQAPDYWKAYAWHSLEKRDTRGEYTAELVLADYGFALGRDTLAQGRVEEALAAFDRSLAAVGENKESLNNVGSACAEGGQFEAALEYYARALELDPKYELSLKNLGKVYLAQGKPENALGLFDRVLEEAPMDREAHRHAAECLRAMGRGNEALARYRRLAELAPEDPALFRDMGDLLRDQGDELGARQMYARSLALDPNQPELALQTAQQSRNSPTAPEGLPPIPGLDLPDPMANLPQPPGSAPGVGTGAPALPVPSMPGPPLPSGAAAPGLPGGLP